MDPSMTEAAGFLADKISACDLVMIEVVGLPRPQCLRAQVSRVYVSRPEISAGLLEPEIEFVGAPAHWGQVPLALGDTALVFLKAISGRLYEEAWHGHMVIEQIDGETFAIFQHRELWLAPGVPASIREYSRQDPRRPYASAVRLDVLEAYLQTLLDNVGREGE